MTNLKLIIEAILFTSDKPVNAQMIHASMPDVQIDDIITALKALQEDYDTLGRSFHIKEVAQGFQFRTDPDYSEYILQMLKSSPARLSKAALETLAIIAYKQPVIRQEIEALRGVDSGGILKTLLEKGLIKIMGRKNLPGKPLIYGTSKRFLEVFDLKDLDSLPKLKEIKELGIHETLQPLILEDSNKTSNMESTSEEKSSEEKENLTEDT